MTVQMFQDLNSGPLPGTLPILYVFLARSGKTVHEVNLVHLDEQGVMHPGERTRYQAPARGVKIVFSEKDGPQKTLYYFSTNLADAGGHIPLLQFCKSLGQGDSFLKSASYLLHTQTFSQVRKFILDNSNTILQDDTGVPLSYFDTANRQLRGYGRYVMPIFPAYNQPKLNEFFQKSRPAPLDFGVGYRWRPNESNLLLAVRNVGENEATSTVSQETALPQQGVARPQDAVPDRETAVVRPQPVNRRRSPAPPFPIIPFFPFIQLQP
jgi:hypothetical protein